MLKKFVFPMLAVLVPVAATAGEADLAAAQQAVLQVEQDYVLVGKLVESAWEANDQIKYSCLNAKAAQLQLHVRHANTALERASDSEGAERNRVVEVLLADAAQAAQLRTEAENCAGLAEASAAADGQGKGEDGTAQGTANLENGNGEQREAFDPLDTAQSRAAAPALPSVKAPALPVPASPVE